VEGQITFDCLLKRNFSRESLSQIQDESPTAGAEAVDCLQCTATSLTDGEKYYILLEQKGDCCVILGKVHRELNGFIHYCHMDTTCNMCPRGVNVTTKISAE
jgi:hypothetical protein